MRKFLGWGLALASAAFLFGCTASRTVIVHDDRPVVVAKTPGHIQASRMHTRNGIAFYERGHFRKAVQQFELAIAKDPNNWEAHYYLAESYRELHDFDRCLVHYHKVRDLHHDDPHWVARVEFGIGLVFERRGNLRDARHHFELALVSDPGFEPAKRGRDRLVVRRFKDRHDDDDDDDNHRHNRGHGKKHDD